jgi:hypothetical protein
MNDQSIAPSVFLTILVTPQLQLLTSILFPRAEVSDLFKEVSDGGFFYYSKNDKGACHPQPWEGENSTF